MIYIPTQAPDHRIRMRLFSSSWNEIKSLHSPISSPSLLVHSCHCHISQTFFQTIYSFPTFVFSSPTPITWLRSAQMYPESKTTYPISPGCDSWVAWPYLSRKTAMVGVTHMLHNVGAKEGNILFFCISYGRFWYFFRAIIVFCLMICRLLICSLCLTFYDGGFWFFFFKIIISW